MVTLKKLKLNNFLSHKDTEFSFKENTKLSIEGISGSGKSSIVEAIIWVLYGKGRVENRNIIKRGALFSTVVLELEDNGKVYRIERNVTSTGKHVLNIGEKKAKAFIPLKTVGLKDSQVWIEKELLKSSYTLFINSVAYPQDNIESFVKQTAIKRKELLMEIANTDNYDELYNKSKAKLDEIREKTMELAVKLRAADTYLENTELLIKAIPVLTQAKDELEKEMTALKNRIGESRAAESYIKEIESQISGNNMQVLSIKSRILETRKSIEGKKKIINESQAIDPNDLKNAQERLAKVRVDLASLELAQKADYEANLKRQAVMSSKRPQSDYSATLGRLEGQLMDIIMSTESSCCLHEGRDCPKLEHTINVRSKFVEEQIKDIKERIAEQEKHNEEYVQALAAIPAPNFTQGDLNILNQARENEKTLSQYETLAGVREEKAKNIAYLAKEVEDLSLLETMLGGDIESLEAVNGTLKAEIAGIKYEEALVLDQLLDQSKTEYFRTEQQLKTSEGAKEDAIKMKAEQKKLLSGIKEYEKDQECLELAKEAFGSKGIKTVVIDYLIPRLEYRINEILSKMSDFKIRLETQKSKFDGEGMSEGLFINIYNEAGECFPLANYSGGQKLKITVAISEALATMQNSGFRIFDEIFLSLDEESAEGFNNVIGLLQEKFSQILCISHLRIIQDSFSEKLFVKNTNGNSSVEKYEKN